MNIELNLGEPILKCYQKGRFMTMMLSQNINTLPWICYSNLQICCHKLNDKGEAFVIDVCNSVAPFLTKEWDACPYIRDNSFSIEEIIERYCTVSAYIVDCLNHHEYVHFCLNTSYVHAYDKRIYSPNMMHDIFICGYDDVEKYFIGYDYFSSDYEKKKIPFSEINEAVINIKECRGIEDYANGIHSFLLQDSYVFSCFRAEDINVYNMLQKMYEVLYPQYSEVNNLMKWRGEGKRINFFGLNVYDELCIYLESITEVEEFDHRPFYVIKDHIQILNNTIQFFDMPLENESIELLKIAERLSVTALKICINHKYKLKEYLINEVAQIKMKEYHIISELLKVYNFQMN